MKHMKQIAMIAVAIVVAAAGYMAYQRYSANEDSSVKVQFLDFGGSHDHDSDSSYDRGYRAGMNDCQNS